MKRMFIAIIVILAAILAATVVITCCLASGRAADREEIDILEGQIAAEQKANKSAETRLKILESQIEAYRALNQELINRQKPREQPQEQTQEQPEKPTEHSKERLPEGATNRFDGMDFRTITDTKSDQYKLQQECFTGEETGIRYYTDWHNVYYCCALGGAYGIDIGDTWEVTLNNGCSFHIIHAEFKHDISDPDPNDFGDPCKNYDGEDCTNVIEFVFDYDYVPREVLIAGTFSQLNIFGGLYGDGGNVVSMKYTGRKWSR